MASYIDNIAANAQVVGVQPYTPNWDFLSSAQKTLTQMQTNAFESFYNKYSTFLKSDLLNPENQKFRDDFMKEADAKIKRVGGMDLTDPRNLSSAMTIFDGLVDNQKYVKDIVFTKGVKKDLEYAESLRSSLDENVRKLYNPYSVQEIMYATEDFKNAQGDALLSINKPRYVQGLDLWSRAEEYFDDKEWTRTYDQKSGNYIYTSKNGKLIEGDVFQYLYSRFAEDPLVKDYLSVRSRVQRRNFVEENLESYNGDRNAAEIDYLKGRWNALSDPVRQQAAAYDKELAQLEYANSEVQRAVENQPASNNAVRLEGYQNVSEMFKALKSNRGAIPQIDENVQAQLETGNIQNVAELIAKIDEIQFKTEVGQISGIFSRRGEQLTMKADEFSLANHRASLDDWKDKQSQLRRFNYDLQMAAAKGELAMPQGPGGQGGTPQAVGEGRAKALEGKDNDAYVTYNQKVLDEKIVESRSTGHEAIKQWSLLTGVPVKNKMGQVIALDNLSALTEEEFQDYISKAQLVADKGTADLGDPKSAIALRNKLREHKEASLVATGSLKIEQNNLLDAINRSGAGGDEAAAAKKIIRELVQSGIVNPDVLKEKFVERWDAEREKQVAAAPLFGRYLVDSPKFAVWANTDSGSDVWNAVFGGVSWFDRDTWDYGRGEANTIGGQYMQNAESIYAKISGQGDTRIGYEQRMGTNLGYASSKGSYVNNAVNLAARSLDINAAAVGFGDINDGISGNLSNPDIAETAFKTILGVLNTKTSGNTNARNMQVSMYQDNDGNQYMNIVPDQATIDQLRGNSSTKGIAGDIDLATLSKGIVVKLEKAGALPPSVYDFRTTRTDAIINLNNGVMTIGGNYLDGGEVTISKNGDGSYTYYATEYLYDPSAGKYKERNITRELTQLINSQGLSLQQSVEYIKGHLNETALTNIKLEKDN
jgi:hypothetical protein